MFNSVARSLDAALLSVPAQALAEIRYRLSGPPARAPYQDSDHEFLRARLLRSLFAEHVFASMYMVGNEELWLHDSDTG